LGASDSRRRDRHICFADDLWATHHDHAGGPELARLLSPTASPGARAGISTSDLLVVAAWGSVALLIAARTLQFSPRAA
jgi:hypothetical protein